MNDSPLSAPELETFLQTTSLEQLRVHQHEVEAEITRVERGWDERGEWTSLSCRECQAVIPHLVNQRQVPLESSFDNLTHDGYTVPIPFYDTQENVTCLKCAIREIGNRVSGLDWSVPSPFMSPASPQLPVLRTSSHGLTFDALTEDQCRLLEWRRIVTLNLWLWQLETCDEVFHLQLEEHLPQLQGLLERRSSSWWLHEPGGLDQALLEDFPAYQTRLIFAGNQAPLPAPTRFL